MVTGCGRSRGRSLRGPGLRCPRKSLSAMLAALQNDDGNDAVKRDNGMLPEWAEQGAVLLSWPHDQTDWLPWLPAIEADYVELASAISTEVTPLILCRDEAHREHVAGLLAGRCQHAPRLVVTPVNDTWCRDYGPVSVRRDGRLELLDFRFQGWGSKYEASLDDAVNTALAELWQAPLRRVEFELEGGSIETDGQGSLLTTEHCLLDSERNQEYSREEIEALVLRELGLDRVLWISKGALLGDDTDSHIDNLVRFCDPHTIACLVCSREDDVHYQPLQEMAEQVRALRQPGGSPYRVVPVELPEARFDEDGKRLPASYVNFLILNGSVLVPVFGCAEDALALNALQQAFPGKRMVPVPGNNLIRQFGGPHCATMQLPLGVVA